MRKIQLLLFTVCSAGFLVMLPRLEGMTPPEGAPDPAVPTVTDVSSSVPSLHSPGSVAAAGELGAQIAAMVESSRRQEQTLQALHGGLERLDLRLQAVSQAIVTEVRSLAVAQARLEAKLEAPADDSRILQQLSEIHTGIVAAEARLERLGPLEERVKKLEQSKRAGDQGLRGEVEQMRERLRRVELDRIQMLGKLLESSASVKPSKSARADDDD